MMDRYVIGTSGMLVIVLLMLSKPMGENRSSKKGNVKMSRQARRKGTEYNIMLS
jgi:hypothetical protein